MKQFLVIAITALTLLATSATSAEAYIRASIPGSVAVGSGRTVSSQDTSNDWLPSYTVYWKAGSVNDHYLYNHSGPDTTVYKTEGSRITWVKACVDNWGPDTCSGWVS